MTTNTNINTNSSNFTAYIVARNLTGALGTVINQGNWSLALSDERDYLVFKVGDITLKTEKSIDNESWHMIKLDSYGGNISISVDKKIIGSLACSTSGSVDGIVTIGNNIKGNIGEIIIYSDKANNYNTVETYLMDKYSIY